MAKDKVITPDDAKDIANEALKRVRGKTRNKPVQAELKAKAAAQEPKVKLTKKEKAIEKAQKEVDKAELKLKEAKQKLDEAKRLLKAKDIKKQEKAVKKAQDDLKKAKEKLRKAKGEKPMDLRETAKRANKNEEKRKKAGMDNKDKDKDKDKNKDKNKEKTQQNDKLKLASHINLPSGMRIRQDGPNYVLVTTDKSGKELTTPVTDVINQIDKYNKNVDAQNASLKAQSIAQPVNQPQNLTPTNDGLKTSGVTGNVQVSGTPAPVLPTVPANELKGAEDIAAASGKIKPEDVKQVAETAMQLSKLGILKDPHALEELNKRKKRQEERKEANNRKILESQVR